MLKQENCLDDIEIRLKLNSKERNSSLGYSSIGLVAFGGIAYLANYLEHIGMDVATSILILPAGFFAGWIYTGANIAIDHHKKIRRLKSGLDDLRQHEPNITASTTSLAKFIEAFAEHVPEQARYVNCEFETIMTILRGVSREVHDGLFIHTGNQEQGADSTRAFRSSYETLESENLTGEHDQDFYRATFTYSFKSNQVDMVRLSRRVAYCEHTRKSMRYHNRRSPKNTSSGFVRETVSIIQIGEGSTLPLIDILLQRGYVVNQSDEVGNLQIQLLPTPGVKPWEGYKSNEPIVFYNIGELNNNSVWAVTHRKSGYLE